MTISRTAARSRIAGSALLVCLTCAPGAARADAGGAPGLLSGWTVALGLLGATCLVALLTVVLRNGSGARRRRRLLCARLDRLGLPALVSSMNGRVQWANGPMREAYGDGPGEVLDRLGSGIEVDAGLIYRMARRAREMGFAVERVHRTATGDAAALTAQLDLPDRLVWTVSPPDRHVSLAAGRGADAFEGGLVPHLHVDARGVATANQRFRELFGDPAALLSHLSEADTPFTSYRGLLPGPDGDLGLNDVCVVQGRVDDADSRDVFVFPVTGNGSRAGATVTLEAVPVALAQFNLYGRMMWCNAPARQVFGAEVKLGTGLADLVEPLGRPIDALIAEAVADAKGWREMVRLRRAAHETFLQITLTPVTLDGQRSLLAVLNDASELRLLEDKFAQSQKMEAVGKLAGGVAHDFNNVLTAISGHSDLLLLGKDALDPDYSDLIQIRQNTHRAAALVRQLLAFSRKQTLNPTLLSVQDVVSDTQYLLNRLIGEKVTLALEHGRELGAVRADHQQLEQALMNLVVNARDAMPSGGTITIATRNLTLAERMVTQGVDIPAGKYVEISVADEGVGIAPEVIEHVFEPFFTTKALGEGTGLGLATVYGIVKQSGGYVFCENRPDGGARFRILLPRVERGAAHAPVVRDAPESDRRDLTGKGRILLVEDEDPVRAFASRALKLRGYEVSVAASAEEAMEFLSQSGEPIDLLISDVVMPGMDGPTFSANARKMRPGLRVIFISGYAEDSFRRNLVDHDFLFLPKPFSLTDLTAKVKEALEAPG